MGIEYAWIPKSIWHDPSFTAMTSAQQLEWFWTVIERSYYGRPHHVTTEQRRFIYGRDGHACVTCGSGEDLTIDHIYPRALGGTDDTGNLQTLCRRCNSTKGARV